MKTKKTFALKGNIIYSETPQSLFVAKDSYLVCEAGKVAGVFAQLPQRYADIEVRDESGRMILPGFVDLHIHAPQYAFRGLGMDKELLAWLETQTFPAEAKYADEAYAERAYEMFVRDMAAGFTTRACIFATLHLPATLMLMRKLEQSGLVTMVGKVNMDRNSPDDLCEADAKASLAATREWLKEAAAFANTRPILTPRFIPSCSDELMQGLAAIQKETGLPVQSHLSENISEGAWVQKLCPDAKGYADAYRRFGLLGSEACPVVMAHCVYPGDGDVEMLHDCGTFVAHCPASNTNLSSGIAPMREYLQAGVNAGLGTDVAGGFSASILRAMSDAIQVSKLRWRLIDAEQPPLTLEEAFYLGTRGGGAFFGSVGAFEAGYEFDALVVDDSGLACPDELDERQRLERLIYLADERCLRAKYVQGRELDIRHI